MPSPVALLSNLMPAPEGPVSGSLLKRLQAAATLDGKVDRSEKAFFRGLARGGRLDDAQRVAVDTWLAKPSNPEVGYVRKTSPAFDARVAALTKHAKPGDLIFWQDTTGSRLATFLGEFPHVSVVLNDGKVLDTMSIEGVSISTKEAVIAKAERRMKAGDIRIGRPATPLTKAQLSELTAIATRLQGREYALLSPMCDPKSPLSCSRSVYEALKGAGVDLAPTEARVVRNAVMPGDLMKGVTAVGTIGKDGAFRAAEGKAFAAWKPTGPVAWIGKAWDALMTHFPSLWPLLERYQAGLQRALRRV